MERFLKIYLPLFYAAVILIVFVLPSYRVYKQTGINPVTFGKEPTAHNYSGNVMKVILALLFVVILIFAMSEKMYAFTVSVVYLESNSVKWIGLLLCHLSLLWIVIAQTQMKNSWRIGIDAFNSTALVTDGLFAISRNPIFLGMIVCVAGIFLIIPNAITFSILMATYFVIQIQIRLEEEHLGNEHGLTYETYIKKTRRLI